MRNLFLIKNKTLKSLILIFLILILAHRSIFNLLLTISIEYNKPISAIWILNHGASANSNEKNLCLAVKNHETYVWQLLLSKGANPSNSKFNNGNPLTFAVINSDINAINTLIQYGEQVDALDPQGYTALETACFTGDENVINCLLEHHPNVNNQSNSHPPLMIAVSEKKPEIVKLLLKNGANANVLSKMGTPLELAINGNDYYSATYLLHSHANPNLHLQNNYPPLLLAIKNNNPRIVKLLLDYGANPNEIVINNFSVMQMTDKSKYPICVALLINAMKKKR